MELAAGVVVLRPHAPAIAVAPRPLLVTRAAQVRACTGGQSVAGEVRSDPCKGARPPGSNTPISDLLFLFPAELWVM